MKRWQFILLAFAACIASGAYGYSVQPDQIPSKVYVPVCGAMAFAHHHAKPLRLSELQP